MKLMAIRKLRRLAKHQQYRVVTKAVERLNLEEKKYC